MALGGNLWGPQRLSQEGCALRLPLKLESECRRTQREEAADRREAAA